MTNPSPKQPRAHRPAPQAHTEAGQVKAMRDAAAHLLQPPPHTPLSPNAKPFWRGIVTARARDEWDEASLVVAAQLAECQAAIAEEAVQLRIEGSVLIDGRGTAKVNPRAAIIDSLHRREMAIMRTLRFGGRVSGDPREQLHKRQTERHARAALESLRGEDLLA